MSDQREIDIAAKRLPRDIKAVIKAVAGVLAPEIRALHQRIAELEARPFLHEAGTWEQSKAYGIGAVCTDRGSAWVCKAPTCKRPGESGDWRLLVKRGKDAPR